MTPQDRELFQQALDALETSDHNKRCAVRDRDAFDDREPCSCGRDTTITAIRAHLANTKERSCPATETLCSTCNNDFRKCVLHPKGE